MFQPIGRFKKGVFERRTLIGSYNHCRYQICMVTVFFYILVEMLWPNICAQEYKNIKYKV